MPTDLISFTYKGKTYQMPWREERDPKEEEAMAWVKRVESKKPINPMLDPSIAEFGSQAIQRVKEIGSGLAEQVIDAGKNLAGNKLASFAPLTAITGAATKTLAKQSQEGAKVGIEKAQQAKGIEKVGRYAAIPFDAAGIPISQTAEDIVAGNYGGAAINLPLVLGAAEGLGRGTNSLVNKIRGPMEGPIHGPVPPPVSPKVITDPRRMLPSAGVTSLETPLADVSSVNVAKPSPKYSKIAGNYLNRYVEPPNTTPYGPEAPFSSYPPKRVFTAGEAGIVPPEVARGLDPNVVDRVAAYGEERVPYKSTPVEPVVSPTPPTAIPDPYSTFAGIKNAPRTEYPYNVVPLRFQPEPGLSPNQAAISSLVPERLVGSAQVRPEMVKPVYEQPTIPGPGRDVSYIDRVLKGEKIEEPNRQIQEVSLSPREQRTSPIQDVELINKTLTKMEIDRRRAARAAQVPQVPQVPVQGIPAPKVPKAKTRPKLPTMKEAMEGFEGKLPTKEEALRSAIAEAEANGVTGKTLERLKARLKDESGSIDFTGKKGVPIRTTEDIARAERIGIKPEELGAYDEAFDDALNNEGDTAWENRKKYPTEHERENAKIDGVINGLEGYFDAAGLDYRKAKAYLFEKGWIEDPNKPKVPAAKPRKSLKERMKSEEGSVLLEGRKPKSVEEEIHQLRKETNRKVLLDWANKRKAADFRGGDLAKEWSDLRDLGEEAIHAYQKGDRSGPLAKLEPFFKKLHQEAVQHGLLKENQIKENYVRQIWKDDPEKVARVFASIPKEPGFSKKAIFKSYAQGKAAGLTPKYTNLADIAGVYLKEHGRAVANAELYDYLVKTKQIDMLKPKVTKGGQVISRPRAITAPHTWAVKGAHAAELGRLLRNEMEGHKTGIKNFADVVSWTKNLYLAGGIPGTALNIHGYNILKSDIAARGYVKGLHNFFKGTFNPASDVRFLEKNRHLIPELIEKGYEPGIEGHSIEGRAPIPFDDWLEKYKGGRGVKKVITLSQKIFEDPLFQVKLPATKLRFTLGQIEHYIKKGMTREAAIRQAANDANVAYGGINKALRDKTVGDLTRIGILAPDWAESRARLAGRQIKGVAKTVVGKGDAVDKFYAKTAGRSLSMDLAAKGAAVYLGKKLLDSRNSSELYSIPLGETEDRKEVSYPIHGTANELIRIPQDIAFNMISKNDSGSPFDIFKNRLSTPYTVIENLVRGQDEYGNPLRKNDRYGRPISFGQSALNQAYEVSRPFQYQSVQALTDYLTGKAGKGEALNKALETGVRYTKKPRKKKAS